ncbi:MAG: hypothetical protein JNM10_01475 [Planctomycetia bacterium]|nr:hypothetical protein [Planctomycetia bacterium]
MAGAPPHGRRGAGRASRSLARFGASVAVALLAGGEARAPARADSIADREAMLGRVGVPDDLRPRIHRAIDTGAVWLARHLDKDDQFRFAGPDRPAADDGSSALVTLALAHAGTPTVLPAARRSAQRLFGLASDGRRVRDGQPTRATYDTGLLGLLSADAGLAVPRTCARELAAAFERGQDARSGGWGYQLTTGGGTVSRLRPGAKAPVPVRNPVNLSTTQFAALGAHAAGLAGAPVDLDVWRRHAEGLCAAQAQDGSWTYDLERKAPRGYPNGTYMGLASLVLAEAALAGRVEDAALLQRVAVARLRGIAALRRDVDALLDALRGPKRGVVPFLDGYSLYALEKACVFAGIEQVAGGSWYVRLAEAVVARQDEDGSWGRDPIQTSFLVLFLARSPERSAPVTTVTDPPRPARPAAPTTPSEPSTPTPR